MDSSKSRLNRDLGAAAADGSICAALVPAPRRIKLGGSGKRQWRRPSDAEARESLDCEPAAAGVGGEARDRVLPASAAGEAAGGGGGGRRDFSPLPLTCGAH
jgi:hypothetical protein